jgi:hypothetical protein
VTSTEKMPDPIHPSSLNHQRTRRPAGRSHLSPTRCMHLFISAAKAWGRTGALSWEQRWPITPSSLWHLW